ncbi:MAG: hypothetical protein ACD_81C00011G0002 [uncultured bacterium]|uniref:Methyltransferase type 11 domain-containing protein n=1 Tax=Candidatus Wolfebacteria bacterium GW2011_GWC2_39_22 TaxID=1619013 RepID=A0A0G0N9Z1_9BACT|nr:MAG: hypothetical protein ACD_81C00011G0002 [uncultured bacterium]KKR12273.1 MAG: hypothetical protein UT41_C0002G0047 [Candidatus Wolfebacteria bacterium GW2011_GWC2_39_22]HBI25904.1 hypothetical protein [Candidatus Wolfebacteria bacterium]
MQQEKDNGKIPEIHEGVGEPKEKFAGSAITQDIETTRRAAEGKGKKLEELYKGFFGSKENCGKFTELIPEEMYGEAAQNIMGDYTIVDAGSSQGTLGNYVREKFVQKGGKGIKLVMVDTNGLAMEMSPVEADEKIVGNLLESVLPPESARVIILRSVLQYMEPKEQKKVLSNLFKALKPGGILVSQFGSYETQEQADMMNTLFGFAERRVCFCGKEEGIKIHKDMFVTVDEVKEGPVPEETFDEFFVDRVNATPEQIAKAKQFISEHVDAFGDALTSTTEPYAWQIPYTLVRCKKNQ